ncbi:BMC domain-containing protein [Desulfosporosinus fructosivorans]|uniref:BMC domain-containing protein n=1 Tax=Desulfosporosinus fructosivorans TaxID=2018669 RepID=A0A4Z0R8J0_9FIRM|nr:BMC domain-containing protein [Desulfosporosinus fructosivorans]TGE39491.1 BMC domain-containing protein [Desulfosporosinus fructosivorans]
MQALGLIETRGFLPAIECADVMLKTAQVELLGRTFVGGGLVTIAVTGDVGAVKAAVEAGVTAVKKIGDLLVVSQHVIPRPHPEIESMIVVREISVEEQPRSAPQQEKSSILPGSAPTTNLNEPIAKQDPTTGTEAPMTTLESTKSEQIMLSQIRKEEVDALVEELGLEKSVDILKSLSVVKLRNLAREYKDLGVAGRAISKANKEMLIQKLKGYYERE